MGTFVGVLIRFVPPQQTRILRMVLLSLILPWLLRRSCCRVSHGVLHTSWAVMIRPLCLQGLDFCSKSVVDPYTF